MYVVMNEVGEDDCVDSVFKVWVIIFLVVLIVFVLSFFLFFGK